MDAMLLRPHEAIRILLIIPQGPLLAVGVYESLRRVAAELLTGTLLVLTTLLQLTSLLFALHVSIRHFLEALAVAFAGLFADVLTSALPFSGSQRRVLGVAIARAALNVIGALLFAPLLLNLPFSLRQRGQPIAVIAALQVACEWSLSFKETLVISKRQQLYASVSLIALALSIVSFVTHPVNTHPEAAAILTFGFTASALSGLHTMAALFPSHCTLACQTLDILSTYTSSCLLYHHLVHHSCAVPLLTVECVHAFLLFIFAVSRLVLSVAHDLRIHRSFPRLTSDALQALADDDVCAVCLDSHNAQSCRLACAHLVHRPCLVNVLNSARPSAAPQCPVCRAAIFVPPGTPGDNPAVPPIRPNTERWMQLMQQMLANRLTRHAGRTQPTPVRRLDPNVRRAETVDLGRHLASAQDRGIPAQSSVNEPNLHGAVLGRVGGGPRASSGEARSAERPELSAVPAAELIRTKTSSNSRRQSVVSTSSDLSPLEPQGTSPSEHNNTSTSRAGKRKLENADVRLRTRKRTRSSTSHTT